MHLNDLQVFLRERKTVDLPFHTHVLVGSPYGTYSISKDIDRFWQLYLSCAEEGSKHLYIAERPMGETPVLVDVDLKVKKANINEDVLKRTNRIYTSQQVQEIITAYQNTLRTILTNVEDDALLCILLEKPYYETELNKDIYIKNGFHLHFPKLFMDRKAQEVYLIPIVQEKLADLFAEIGCTKPIDTNSVNVHWLMYGSAKPGNRPYRVSKAYADGCREVDLEEALTGYVLPSFSAKGERVDVNRDNVHHLMPKILSTFLCGRDAYYYTTKKSVDTPITHQYEKIKSNRKQYEQLSVTEQLAEAEVLLSMLAPYRSEQYSDWIQVGSCLKNISDGDADGFSMWLEFSERCEEKYNEANCIRKWNSFRSKFTTATLHHFAKTDSPSAYEAYVKSKSSTILKETILNDGHNDMAQLLYNAYKTDFVCTSLQSNKWYKFDKHIYTLDESGVSLRKRISDPNAVIIRGLTDLIAKIGDEMGQCSSDKIKELQAKIKKAGDLIKNCKNAPYKENVMREAREVFYNPLFDDLLDKDPNLIAFKNGVYSFTHSVFRPGKPEDYLSTDLPIDYIDFGSVDHPDVVKILDFFRKMFPNQAIREYFLDQVCQVFVGGNHDKVVLFWTGVGNNGKTVTQTLFEKMLGKFAVKFNTTLITGKKPANGSANPEMARAGNGVRWAVMEEPNPDEHINAGSLKWMTGNDTVFARDLYEKGKGTKEITPLFKLHIICNKLPPIKDADIAVRNRVRVIPFESTFVEESECPHSLEEQFEKKIFPMDKDFTSKLSAMREALAWFLIYRYQRLSRGEKVVPPEVIIATDAYMRDNDIFKQFESQRVFVKPEARLRPHTMYDAFKEWFREECPSQSIPTRNTVINYFNNRWGFVEKYWLHKTCEIQSSDDEE